MNKLCIFSGKCIMGIAGEGTLLMDDSGNELFVGDIVATHSKNGFANLTCVVSDGFTTFSGGEIERGPGAPFFMGIKDANLSDWTVIRLKKWSDCIEGERWPEYGFNFRTIDVSVIKETSCHEQ